MFSLMNKSLKTIGKAVSQVAKECETIGDDNSLGAQSHVSCSSQWVYLCYGYFDVEE